MSLIVQSLPVDPVMHLQNIIERLRSNPSGCRLTTQLEFISSQELRRRRWPMCMATGLEDVRVPSVAASLLQFCTTHRDLLNARAEIWTEVHAYILQHLNVKTRRSYAKQIAPISDQFSLLAKNAIRIAWPEDKKVFPDSLDSLKPWIEKAFTNPLRYRLTFAKIGAKGARQRMLYRKDLITNELDIRNSPYSFRNLASPNTPPHWVLISKQLIGEGSFSKARICWDLTSKRWLIQKGRGIMPRAQPIIYQIAKNQFPGVVPIVAISNDRKWRMYEKCCRMDLFECLRTYQFDAISIKNATHQLLAMLASLHNQTYLLSETTTCPAFHGDIKPENILLTEEGDLVLTDFGSTSPSGVSGTYCYASPEILSVYNALRQNKPWSLNVQLRQSQDVWSMGIILCQLLTRRYTTSIPSVEAEAQILSEKQTYETSSISQKTIDEDLVRIKQGLFLTSILEPIWVCVEKMLRKDPTERISAQEALRIFMELSAQTTF